MLKSLFFYAFFTTTIAATAQQISNEVINSTGGFGQISTGYSVEYTVGEAVVTTLSEPTMQLTQGFLQPESRLIIPIELLFFNAQLIDKQLVRLKWATASELNADYFSVEKSLNGVDFRKIGQVQAAGNSSKTHNYFYDDVLMPDETTIYYRLKQIDVGGTFKHTKIVAVSLSTNDKNSALKVYPNPAQNTISVVHSVGLKSINIYTIQGVLIKKTTSTDVDISDYAAGLYVLEVENTEGGTSRATFVKLF